MAITALYTAATGMQASATKIDVIANNIANSDTYGFKPSRANFQDVLYQVRAQPGVQTGDDTSSPLGTQIGLGVTVSNTQLLFQQGSPLQTGNGLDVMIEGDGFFRIQLPDGGTAYTRAGNFIRNAANELVLGHGPGYRLLDAPTIPADVSTRDVSISTDGRVIAKAADGSVSDLGQLTLARFVNPAGLLQSGANLYLETPASGEAIEDVPGANAIGRLNSGYLELSTTEAVAELVELIKAQRVFQMNSQTIQAADESLRVVANLRR